MAGLYSKGYKLTKVADASTSSTASVNTSIVDMAGYQSVQFFSDFGTANSGNLVKVQQNAANSTDGMADLEGTGLSSGTSDEDVLSEVYEPLEQYVRAQFVRDGTASTLGAVWCIQSGPRTYPTTNAVSGTMAAEGTVSPAEGTA